MIKKQDKHKYILKLSKKSFAIFLTAISLISVIVLAAILVPLETIHVGECGGQKTRLSLIFDGHERIDNVRIEAKERALQKQEILKQNPGWALGCSLGPKYDVYLL